MLENLGRCSETGALVVTDPINKLFLRQIEVAVLEQIEFIGKKFVKKEIPENWDFLVYRDMVGRYRKEEESEQREAKKYDFLEIGFFYNFKRWAVKEKEKGISSAIKRLGFNRR